MVRTSAERIFATVAMHFMILHHIILTNNHSTEQKIAPALPQQESRGFIHPTILKYLYTVGLLSPHTLASSLTFILPVIYAG